MPRLDCNNLPLLASDRVESRFARGTNCRNEYTRDDDDRKCDDCETLTYNAPVCS